MPTPDFSPSRSPDQAAFALTSDEEWVIVTEAQLKPGFFHFAIARRDVILMQGEFSLEPGMGLGRRLEQVGEELGNGKLHVAFHKLARAQGVKKLRKPQACKGMCPWTCPGLRFEEIRLKYSWKVPSNLRQRGMRLFLGWETPLVSS